MRISDKEGFGGLAAMSLGMLVGARLIGEVFHVPPCYWCSFQRLLCMLLMVFGLGGVLFPRWRRLWAVLSGLAAMLGVFAAGRQSWMQYTPEVAECGFGDPSLVERLVDWLSGGWPSMFMVTGLCKEKDWVFLGLSLANWSGLCFLLLSCTAFWLLFCRNGQGR